MNKSEVFDQVRGIIISSVNLHHLDPNSIANDTSLRDGGLELDSIDVLEVVVAIEQHFKVKVADADTGKKYFRTVGGIADFILLQSTVTA